MIEILKGILILMATPTMMALMVIAISKLRKNENNN